ncbi:tail protein X [Serratia plymuthica]|uniref:tail protein X n=1 Tax=Serratia plymuthica TaxID=82996 RepID=UPI000937A08E|nr:tail protein X [Serratia plymuthica]OJT41530.1 phage tail protein [Serratia plymuthica]
MPMIYQTRDGDVLDEICADHYGMENLAETVVAVLEANQGLAALGAVFDAGVIITLPDISLPAAESAVQLWD